MGDIYGHNIYDNVRSRVAVVRGESLLMLAPQTHESGWTLPGGGLEQNESLFECGEREVFEETGVRVDVRGILFLREWIVPKYCQMPEDDGRFGYGIEVYMFATLRDDSDEVRRERLDMPAPTWIPFDRLRTLPVWPTELKTLGERLLAGPSVHTVPTLIGVLEEPSADPSPIEFDQRVPSSR